MRSADAAGRAQGEGWRVRKDGSRFWGDEIMSPIRKSTGELQGFAKVVRDLTERQRAALEREQLYTEAQQANRLKDEFLGTVSHELRTPLNAILSWAQLLETENAIHDEARKQGRLPRSSATRRCRRSLSTICWTCRRLFLEKCDWTFSRPPPADSLQRRGVAAAHCGCKGIALEVTHRDDDHFIAADARRLQQVVWNLVSNAIKFTPAGGRICLEGPVSGRGTDIVVEDTGLGIPPEVLPFIFDRFRQADSSTKRNHGGVGLGLAIVRHLVELHGGHVEVVDRGAGRGTTFQVRLPIARLAPPVQAAPGPGADPLGWAICRRWQASGSCSLTTTKKRARSSRRSSAGLGRK
jgi:signal transduction histidine kinase